MTSPTNHSHNDLPRLQGVARRGARSAAIQPLIAFYHSDRTPEEDAERQDATRADVKKFLKAFPQVKLLQPWNEANRGYVKAGGGSFRQPERDPVGAVLPRAEAACPKCTIVGLDVLDSTNVPATIRYINVFKRDVGPKHQPSIWGLHNYSDTNRFRSAGTRAVLADTQRPGVADRDRRHRRSSRPSFPFSLSRQTRATAYMFTLAALSSRITRLYIFQWTGGHQAQERFDAGLTRLQRQAAPGVLRRLRARSSTRSRCPSSR